MPRPAARRRAALPQSAEVCEPRTLLTTFVVTDGGDVTDDADGALTYREALLAAEAEAGADIITFADGVDVVTLEADLPTLTGDLSVVADAAGVIIDHAGFSGLTLVGGNFTFSEVEFVNAERDAAAALDVSGGATLTVTGGVFGKNTATDGDAAGGVVRVTDSDATFTGVLIRQNDSPARGGIAAVGDSEVRLVDVRAVSNRTGVIYAAANDAGDEPAVFVTGGEWALNSGGADQGGSAFLTAGSLTITGGRFSTNFRGLIRATDADVTITGAYFAQNGGGVVRVEGGSLAVTDATFSTNRDGAISLTDAGATVADSLFLRNENEDRFGGAIGTGSSTLTVTGSTFRGNTAAVGGAVYVEESSASLVDTRMFANGKASANLSVDAESGGAVFLSQGAEVAVEGGRYAQNTAARWGGAFAGVNARSLSISNASINRNAADGSSGRPARGGGVFLTTFGPVTTDLSVTDVFAARNAAEGDRGEGGAFYLEFTDAAFVDSNIAAGSAGRRGGNAFVLSPDVSFTNTFLRGGRAGDGAGLYVGGVAGFVRPGTGVTLTGGGLIGNRASGRGGGLRVDHGRAGFADVLVTWDGVRVRGNRAAEGGAAFVQRTNAQFATLEVTGDSVLRNNRAADRGGAFAVQGRVTLDGVTAVGNRADSGGVAHAFEGGSVRLLDALFRDNGDDPLAGPGNVNDFR